MIAKQLSVFMENRKGRIGEVLDVLRKSDVNILSLSLADTTEYGLLRLIVDNAELGKERLASLGFSTMLTNILIVKIEHKAGSLQVILNILSKNDINVEYMYGLSVENNNAYIVIKASNLEFADKILLENGIKTITAEQLLGE